MKHLSAKVFYEVFSNEYFDQYIEWVAKDYHHERVICYINYSSLSECQENNIVHLLDYIYQSPEDIIKALALALDAVRYYVKKMDKRKEVVVRLNQ